MMIQDRPRPEWTALARPGCRNVRFRVLLDSDGIAIANLRLSEDASTDEHAAAWDIDVVCVSGSGFTSVGPELHPLAAGQLVRWPRDVPHRLWTEATGMETLMIERKR